MKSPPYLVASGQCVSQQGVRHILAARTLGMAQILDGGIDIDSEDDDNGLRY